MASFSSLSTGLSTGGILGMRGLNVFIQDIRNAPSKEHEQKRVDKELANIRKKFRNTDLSSCLLYTSPSPRDKRQSRMPSSA